MANSETVAFNFDPLGGAGGAAHETVASNFHPLVGGARTADGGGATVNPVGINIAVGGVGSLSPEGFPLFKNRVRESRGFTDAATGNSSVALSAAGWPTAYFIVVLYDGNILPSWYTSGAFACGFLTTTGTETITTGQGVVSNIVRGAIGTYTTFDLTMSAGPGGFKVTGTSGTIANVFAFLPAYRSSAPLAGSSDPIDNPTTSAAFTAEAIAHYRQYAHLRFMQWSKALTNTQVSTSATRRTPSNMQSNQDLTPGVGDPVIAWSAAPGLGATSGTLTAVWPYPTGNYGLLIRSPNNAQSRICACTKGSASVTWTDALTQACNNVSSYANVEGYPIEWAVALCNACNCGIYINTPALEDGPNSSAGTWSAAVMDYLAAQWTSSGKIYFEWANELWNTGGYPFFVINSIGPLYGFTGPGYAAYRLHAFANLCRSKFPGMFGTQVKQVFAWQTTVGGLSTIDAILTALALLNTPSADVQYVAIAPYVTPTVANGDSIAVIEATTSSAGSLQALNSTSENIAIRSLKAGIALCSYESGSQWNVVNGNNANVGLAIMDSGMSASLVAYYQGIFDCGFSLVTHFSAGVAGSTGNRSPTNELSNLYAAPLSSPTLTALQSFMAGATPTRNVVSGTGSVVSGINYADNSAALVNAPGAFNFNGANYGPNVGTSGYCPYLVNCTKPGSYALLVNFTVSSGSPTTDLEVNGALLSSAVPVTTGNVALGNVTLKAGANYVLLGKSGSQAGVAVNSLTFN